MKFRTLMQNTNKLNEAIKGLNPKQQEGILKKLPKYKSLSSKAIGDLMVEYGMIDDLDSWNRQGGEQYHDYTELAADERGLKIVVHYFWSDELNGNKDVEDTITIR